MAEKRHRYGVVADTSNERGSEGQPLSPAAYAPEVITRPLEDREPSPEDIWIAVTGVTGAGKSTFISLLVDQEIEIGHGLSSGESVPKLPGPRR